MGIEDKVKNEAREAAGKAKEWLGDKKDDEQLKSEGRSDELKGKAGQAGERVKDTAADAKDAFSR
jgi:uncharacterized protein YjbJ (UPF0337 family)